MKEELISEAFEKDLASLINKHSLENGSDTPDFILARHMVACLLIYNQSANQNSKWYKEGPLVA